MKSESERPNTGILSVSEGSQSCGLVPLAFSPRDLSLTLTAYGRMDASCLPTVTVFFASTVVDVAACA